MDRNGLNTLEYAQRLERAGVPREQAEVQASMFYEIINSELAKRRDLEEVKVELKRDIEKVRADLKRDIEEVKAELKRDMKDLDLKIENVRSELKRDMAEMKKDLKIWLGGFAVAGFGMLVALSKLGLLQAG